MTEPSNTPTVHVQINTTGLVDGDLVKFDEAGGEFVRVTPAQVLAGLLTAAGVATGDVLLGGASHTLAHHAPVAAPAVPAAITGGESPTEAEFLALRTTVAGLVTALQTIGILT